MSDNKTMEQLSDEELVVLALDNSDNFSQIINRYKIKLFNYIRKISGLSPEDAEDVLQDVFLKTYLNLNAFDKSLKFSSWIYSIAHNQVISNYRKLKARAEGHSTAIDDNIAQGLFANIKTEEEIDAIFLSATVSSVLEKMDQKYQEVLILRYSEEKSYQEISDIIRRPTGTVASLINRAKAQFKQIYLKSVKSN